MKSKLFVVLLAVLMLPGACLFAKTDITAEGDPFQAVAASIEDTGFIASGGPDNPFTDMTDGDTGTKHDTWSGDVNGSNEFDSVGFRFASGKSDVAIIQLTVGTFGDGGWWNSAEMMPVVQVTTDPAFASYNLGFHADAGDDNIWTTVPTGSDYPTDVLDNDGTAENNGSNNVPGDGAVFEFVFDYPETIYGVRIISNGGGNAGGDFSGFIGTAEIKVYTGSTGTAQLVAPTFGQVDVPAGSSLQWNTAVDPNTLEVIADITGHYVYLGIDPDNLVQQGAKLPVGTTQYTPALDKDTIYFWRVDEELNNGGSSNVISGLVSVFETELSLPLIEESPGNTVVWPGEDATFFVSGTDPLGGELSYQWYYDPNGITENDEVQLTDGDGYAGTTTDYLTVVDVQEDDLGSYYCAVSNASGPTFSNSASLGLKKLLGHWPLDSNADDITGNGLDGTVEGGATFDTGAIGQGVVLDGVDGFIDLPDGFADFSTGLTINLWAKVTDLTPAWARFLDFGNGAGTDNILFAKAGAGVTDVNYTIYHGTAWNAGVGANGVFEVDQWHMFTVTQDTDGSLVIYVDGETVQTAQYALPDNIVRVNNYLGKSNWEQDALFKGMIDDVKLYNCALSLIDVAKLYTDVTNESVCAIKPEFDFDDNCIVDIADFAIFAENWLECGLVPDCL